MNGDGWNDVVATWNSTGVWYRDKVTGTWVKITIPASLIAVGDFNGNGRDDLFGVWSSGLWVKYSYTGKWELLTTTLPDDIASGDMDGDGGDDVVATWSGSGVWYYSDYFGTWEKMSVAAIKVAAEHMDFDNKADLIGMWSSGLWVKRSMTMSWVKITSNPPSDIDAGLYRTGTWDMGTEEHLEPAGGYTEGPGSRDHLDILNESVWALLGVL
jgi:hypothetical protein